ncbi:MAG: hypothetical protein WC528_03430 [Patescibacteria group bacterium]
MDAQSKKSSFKRFWWILLIIIILIGGCLIVSQLSGKDEPNEKNKKPFEQNQQDINTNEKKDFDKDSDKGGNFPECPNDLAGILTAPFIDPEEIGAIGPLGWVSPPGHTGATDHNSYYIPCGDPVRGYAPADGWITGVNREYIDLKNTGTYELIGTNLTFTVCKNVVLDFSIYETISESIEQVIADALKDPKACTEGITKLGKEGARKYCRVETNISIKAGEFIGIVKQEPGRCGTFEDWAHDYRQLSSAITNPELKFYTHNGNMKYAICLFDMYTGELKNKYYNLFGLYDDYYGLFTKRTGEPLCGTQHQEVIGSIQGTWYIGDTEELAIIHGDIDHTQGMISSAGTVTGPKIFSFSPAHSGTINREPSEVSTDGQVYCYNLTIYRVGDPAGKMLIQLIDNNHLKAEYQRGACKTTDQFNQPVTLDR